ncbi:alpha/beta hydrolase [Geodermatophilus sp. SYSU D00766]
MSAPGLTAVAGWDTPLLDGAVYTLEAVTERLPPWRARVEAVARALAGAEYWSGQAGTAAATALDQVSAVATEVTGALSASLSPLHEAARQARAAQETAAQALTAAAASGVVLDEAGGVVAPAPVAVPAGASPDVLAAHHDRLAEQAAAAERVAATAAEALHAAARAAAAAADSSGPLALLGGLGAARPAGFPDLPAVAQVDGAWIRSCLPVAGTSPEAVAAWWAGLSSPTRDAVTTADPALVGSLDGLPAWARDQANRVLLHRALADPSAEGYATARAVSDEIAAEEAAGRTVQLWSFDADDHLVALAYGDLDTADDVAFLVPGVGNDVDDLGDMGDDAQAVADAARAAAPAAAVATVAWLGYRPPGTVASPRAWFEGRAAAGGGALAGDLAGLAAARAGDPGSSGTPPRVTVVAHSYGTVVVDRAVEERGELAADALVLLGSPGMDGPASDLEVAEVHEASAPLDPVTWLVDVHGTETDNPDFGATPLPTDPDTWHGWYLERDRPTLAAVGEVVAGAREPDRPTG